jgi:ferredoxin
LGEALATVRRSLALPAVLGYVCPAPCEKGCRRAAADGALSICQTHRFLAESALKAAATNGLPDSDPPKPASGRRVAIVGSGPTGLSAAFYLRQDGHAVTLFEERAVAGGRLRDKPLSEQLPAEVLEAEIGSIVGRGVELRSNTIIGPLTPDLSPAMGKGSSISLEELRKEFDAVLVACGAVGKEAIERLGLPAAAHGIRVEKDTFDAGLPGLFAAGSVVRGKSLVVRSVADGREVAGCIDQYVRGVPIVWPEKEFTVRMGRLEPEEMALFLANASPAARHELKNQAVTPQQAAEEAARCLHCDCRALATCKLRHYAAQYGADPARYKGQRQPFEQATQHAEVIYESGKCIRCGLCIQITAAASEPLGLAFIGRGFDVRVGVPLNRSLEEGLTKVAAECVAACPTAALAMREHGKEIKE